jgi:pimeloyl-ACP methyl ester carboxylesterase
MPSPDSGGDAGGAREGVQAGAAPSRVLLLHGIWMAGVTMQWFGARLRADGFVPETFGYHSIVGGPDEAVPQLARQLRKGGETDIVAHSLGGLVALQALAAEPDLPVRRVVCLGVPVCGSSAAAQLARWPVASLWLGRSARILQEGCAQWPDRFEVGMVAGCLAHGLGGLLAQFDGDNDGTVSVEETRSPRLADHVVVEASHSGLLFSAEAIAQSSAFLRDGRFRH